MEKENKAVTEKEEVEAMSVSYVDEEVCDWVFTILWDLSSILCYNILT